MRYLLDTCVVSELIEKKPHPGVTQWIHTISEYQLFLSVLTFGEIHKGIEKMVESRKKEMLHNWVNHDLGERFKNRILAFDLETATTWGKIQAASESAGRAMPTIDGQIAATGITHGLTVVTRNTADMAVSGVALFNPWQ